MSDMDSRQLLVGHLQAGGIPVRIQGGRELQAGFGGSGPNQVDDDGAAEQGSPTPIVGDMAEHPMFNLVPLAGTGREVADRDTQGEAVSPFLHRHFPQPRPTAIAPASVRHHQEGHCLRIHPAPHLLPPAADGFRGKRGGIVIDSHADPAHVQGRIVDAVRDDLAQLLIREIVGAHEFRGTPSPRS